MPLPAGTRLGPYEILGPLGAGGMGEVYRARDTRLNRDVALKVLPESLAHDPERMARFEREAHVLASLNHPHIATVYGFEAGAIGMELVEGPTLADRIGGRAMPLNEALPIARQIAEGLEYAHERGVVHRDLKPANVKLTADGNVKILDFGLAKALETPAAQGNPSISPTLTLEGTRAGVILGTAAYMAPEQARGAVVDKRADVWAFGVVLYEMLTGKQPFAGPTVSDTLAAVLKTDPDWELVPAEMRGLVRRCLAKDPRLRLRDIGEARIAIEQPATEASVLMPVRSRAWIPWAAAAILLGAVAGGVSLRHFQEKPLEALPARFTVTPPGVTRQFWQAISPDGRKLAFIIHDASGVSRIWVRALDRLAAQPLAGTEGAGYGFFWSPDSRFLAFKAGTQLKKIDVGGGAPQGLGTAPMVNVVGTWGRDGTILVGNYGIPIYRMSASGGEAKPLSELDASLGETGHSMPWLLPDGRHFLYITSGKGTPAIWVTSMDNPKVRKRLVECDGAAVQLAYSQGHLLFVRNSNLMAQVFDPNRLQLHGEPVTLAEDALIASASENGVLAYRTRANYSSVSRLTWFDREGKALTAAGPAGHYYWAALSPDESRIAADQEDPDTGQDVFVIDPARGTSMRLTSHPAHDNAPVWSPDGSRIAFHSDREGPFNLYLKPSNGSGQEEMLLRNANLKTPLDWSSDGRYLLYTEFDLRNRGDLWVLPMTGERQPIPYLRTEFSEWWGKFSPDSRWIAYVSDESGRYQVYVQSFPVGSGKSQISADGGEFPMWRRDGKELYYLTTDGDLMAVEVKTGEGFQAGVPKRLFKAPVSGRSYSVSADGGRFLMPVPVESGNIGLINVVVNWTAELNK